MDFDEDKKSEEGDLDNLDEMLDDLALGDDTTNYEVSKKDSTVFLIDCSQEILTPLEGEEKSQLELIFDGYYNFLQRKIIANASDKVGLILYNVKNSKNSINHNNIYKVHSLDSQVDAQRIKQASLLHKQFKQRFGGISQEKVSLNYVLWEYGTEINSISNTNFYLRLFLFTADDCPHPVGDENRQPSIKRARQLAAKNVQIELFPIRKTKKCHFDIRKFYQEIITFDPEEINSTLLDSSSKILDLQERLRQKQFKKRTLNRLIMKIGKEGDSSVEVAVKIYSFFTKAKKPAPKKVQAKTNRLLVRQVKKVNAKGDVLFNEDLGYYYPLGGEKIKFSKEDMNKVKNFQPPGMTLIGFKPKSIIKPYYNIRTSYFIYPDQEHISGSSQFFDSLISELTQKNLVGIVKLVPRNNQEMRFGAIYPQMEKYDEEDHFQTPPGFHMVILPYAQDIVNFVGEKTIAKPTDISVELLQVTKLLINNLTIHDFDFRDFENPALQKFYSHLQAHALNEKDVQVRPDLLEPDAEGLANFADIIDLVRETVQMDVNQGGVMCAQNYDDDQQGTTPKPTKRSKVKQEDIKVQEAKKPASKKLKIQENGIEFAAQKNKSKKAVKNQQKDEEEELQFTLNVESLVQNNKGNVLKVPELKRYLQINGLSVQGTKDKLVKRIFEFVQRKYTIGSGSI